MGNESVDVQVMLGAVAMMLLDNRATSNRWQPLLLLMIAATTAHYSLQLIVWLRTTIFSATFLP
jgi:hypothetical protein